MQYLIAFGSLPEATNDVVSGRFLALVGPDNTVKFGDPRLNLSRQITPEAVFGSISYGVFRGNFRPEVFNDVISGANVEQIGMDMPVKIGESISNGCRDIRQRSRRWRHYPPFFKLQ